MALATKATRGAVAGNGWTSPANATADDGSYATAAPAKNGTVTGDWDFAAFTDAEIPVGSSVSSVVIRAQYKVSVNTSIATLQSHCVNNGTDVNSSNDTAEPLADTNFDVTFTTKPTLADLKTAGRIVARLVAQRGNSSTAVTFSLDYVELRVTYTPPVPVNKASETDVARPITVKPTAVRFGPTMTVAAPSTERMHLGYGKTVLRAYYDGGGNIKVAKSTNQSYTFGAAATVDSTAGDNDVMLNEPFCRDPVTGRVHLLYGRNIDNGGAPPVLCHKYSDDDGATWSAEHVLDDGGTRGNNRFYRVGIVAYDGVVVVVHSSCDAAVFTTDGFVWETTSTDGGDTWPAIAKLYTSGTVNPSEPNIALGVDGSVHVSWYDPGVLANQGGDVYYVRGLISGGDITWPGSPTQLTSGKVYGRTRVFTSNGVVMIVGNSTWGADEADVGLGRSTDNGDNWTWNDTLVTHTPTFPLDHPWGVIDTDRAAIIWNDNSDSKYKVIISHDAGETWTLPIEPFAATNNDAASQLVLTDDLLIAFGGIGSNYAWSVYPLFSPAMLATDMVDAFDRADENPLSDGGNWSKNPNDANNLKLVSQAVTRQGAPGTFDRSGSQRNDIVISTGGSGEVYATCRGDGGEVDLYLWDPSITSGYQVHAADSDFGNTMVLERLSPGSTIGLGSESGLQLNTDDAYTLRVIDSQVVGYRYDSTEKAWHEFARETDTTYRTGLLPAIDIAGSAGAPIMDDFGGGELVAPSNTTRPTITGTLAVGQVLSCDAGAWATANGATPTRTAYQWQRWNGSTWVDIDLAALPFYTVVSADLLQPVRCLVTGKNSVGATSVGSNQLVRVNRATETDAAQPITGRKIGAVTQASETETARPITAQKIIPVGQATETDAARPITTSSSTIVAVGQALETDVARPVTGRKVGQAAQAAETDAARPVTGRKIGTLAQTVETEVARPITAVKVGHVTQATETDAAQPVSGRKIGTVTQAVETDAAQPITKLGATIVNPAAETDVARPITPVKIGAVGQAVETDAAQPVTGRKIGAVGQAVEADTARPITKLGATLVGQAVETDVARPITGRKIGAVAQTGETDAAQPITGRKVGTVGQTTSTETARPITAKKVATVGQAVETDDAFTLTPRKIGHVAQAVETDVARPFAGTNIRPVGKATETEVARPITPIKVGRVNQATETDAAQPVSGVKVYLLGRADETDEAVGMIAVKVGHVGQASETELARVVSGLKRRLLGRALETDVAHALLIAVIAEAILSDSPTGTVTTTDYAEV